MPTPVVRFGTIKEWRGGVRVSPDRSSARDQGGSDCADRMDMAIDDAFPVSRLPSADALVPAGPGRQHPTSDDPPPPADDPRDAAPDAAVGAAVGPAVGPAPEAVLEQAKGVLIFRYAIDADVAEKLLCLWSAGAGVSVREVAHALVHDICHGDHAKASNPMLVRWLEDRLRHEVTKLDLGAAAEDRVMVTIDHSDASLDAVVEAVRRAARRHVPLVLAVAEHLQYSDPARAHLQERVELAVELAHALEPDVEVRRPPSDT